MGDLLHNMRCVLNDQFDLAFWVGLHKTADQQGSQVVANGERRAHGQRAKTGFAIEQVFDFLGLIQKRYGLRQQLTAKGIQAQAFSRAIEQLAAGLAFQFGDRSAGCRLRKGQQAGSA